MMRNKKRGWLSIGVFLVLFLLVLSVPMEAEADDGLEYEMSADGETVAVTGYTGNGPEVTIPDTMWSRPVTIIREGAFTGNSKVQKINFGKNVKTIEKYSCNRMKYLASLSIPGNVTKIGMSAFNGCENLKELTFESGTSVLTLVCYSFTACPKLMRVDFGTRPVKGVSQDGNAGGAGNLFSGSAISEITIPATVDISEIFSALADCEYLRKVTIDAKSIKTYTFSRCSALAEVVLLNTETIGNGAFSGCTSLTTVTFPDTLKNIGGNAFGGCTSLVQVVLPESVETIGGSAFMGCTSLAGFQFPSKVKEAASGCLKDCTALQTVALPEGLESIGSEAFSGCASLESIYIPAAVSEIGTKAFEGCASLGQITVAEENLTFSAVDNMLYDKAQVTLLRAAQQLEELVLADTVTSIGTYACTGMQRLKSLTVPQQVTAIDSQAFQNSVSLEELSFADGGTELSMGGYAFDGCTGLHSVDFGSREIRVEDSFAFRNTGLVSVKLTENVNTENGSGMFRYCESLESVEVIGEQKGSSLFSYCTGLTTAVLSQMTVVPASLFYESGALCDVTLSEGIQTIGERAFYKTGLDTVILPESLEQIENYAFYSSPLTSIHIPAGVQKIGLRSLEGCQELAEITVDEENSFYVAENNMLFDKTKETLLYLPQDGYGLSSVSIPEGVTKISNRAFSNCQDLVWLAFEGDIPSGVYEPSACGELASISLSIKKIPLECYLFYGEAYPAWETTDIVSAPALNRVQITQEMREIKEALAGIVLKQTKAEDKESLAGLLQRYRAAEAEEQLWIGSSETLEAAYERAAGLGVRQLIQALPAVESLSAEDREAVELAEKEYNLLSGTAKDIVGDTLMLRLRKAVLQMQEILKVKEIRPILKELEGQRGDTIELHAEVLPAYADNRTLLCEMEDLELAEYTLAQETKTITFILKKEGSTAVVLSAADGSGVSVRIPLEVRLPEPQEIQVKRYGATAEIKWQQVEGAASYRVYCSVNGEEFRECGSTPNIIFVYSGLQEGNTYRYRVSAVSGDGHDSTMSTAEAELEIPAAEEDQTEDGGDETEAPQEDEKETEPPAGGTDIPEEKPDVPVAGAFSGKEIEEGTGDGAASPEETKAPVSKKAPQKVKAVNKKKKKVRLTWKKVVGANGYQIYRRTGGKGKYKLIKTIKKGTTVRYVNRKLKKRTYYYKVRAFWKQDGKTVYGKWSKIVKVTVKK